MMAADKDERDSAKLAQLIVRALEELQSPAFADRMRLMAIEKRVKFLALVGQGFSEEQAIRLLKD